jgi:hypothetical protein
MLKKVKFMKKRNIMLLTALFAVILLAGMSMFISCKKEENIKNSQVGVLKTPGNNTMRIFADFSEFQAEVDKTLMFTLEQLESYERTIGFDSYGKMADRAMTYVYNSVENETINAIDLPVIMRGNSEYIQIVTEDGEDYCETRYYQSPFRYVINEDRIFQVDDICFKVFENGHVSCDVSLYYDLLNLTEQDFTRGPLVGDGFTYYCYGGTSSGGGTNNYGNRVVLRETKDKERVRCTIDLVPGYRTSINGCVNIIGGCLQVKTEGLRKTLGIWWKVKRTITNNLSASLYTYDHVKSGSDAGTTFAYKRQEPLFWYNLTLPYGVSNENTYINSYSGTAKIPAVTLELQSE